MLIPIDTFEDIIKFKERLHNKSSDLLECWKEYLLPYKEIKVKCFNDASEYDFNKQVRPIIQDALTTQFSKLETAHSNFLKVIDRVEEKFQHTFSVQNDINIFFYIGLCNGAGWATKVNSKHSVLIGVEKVVELGWHNEEDMTALIYHELCHVAHSALRSEDLDREFRTHKEQSIWQLYIEGFAQRYEQVLYGDDYYHQDKNGWLKWCNENHTVICREYLHRIQNNINTQCFYGDWTNFMGFSDVGYYLGCEFVKQISNKISTQQLATLQMPELETLVINYLKKF